MAAVLLFFPVAAKSSKLNDSFFVLSLFAVPLQSRLLLFPVSPLREQLKTSALRAALSPV